MKKTPGSCTIDHLVITAPTLEAGAAYIMTELGVTMEPGGEHPRMGTHNLLLRLGPTCYLEVIACSPSLPAPNRSRWFALDRLGPDSPPKLATWVARTADIHTTIACATEDPGDVERMSRGELDWLITIPPDGTLPLGGSVPALIQWHRGPHPATRLPDRGLALSGLEVFHPDPDRITGLIASLAMTSPVTVTASRRIGLAARIATPAGPRTLGGVSS